MRYFMFVLLLGVAGCASTGATVGGDTRTYADSYDIVRNTVYQTLEAVGLGVEEVEEEGGGEYIVAVRQGQVGTAGQTMREISRLQVQLTRASNGRVQVRLLIPAGREYGGNVNLQRYRQEFFTEMERRGLTRV